MSITISGVLMSGTITIVSAPLDPRSIEPRHLTIRHDITYDWSPWCIVTTDHETYMTIETIPDGKNVYQDGKKTMRWDESLFTELKDTAGRFDFKISYETTERSQ